MPEQYAKIIHKWYTQEFDWAARAVIFMLRQTGEREAQFSRLSLTGSVWEVVLQE